MPHVAPHDGSPRRHTHTQAPSSSPQPSRTPTDPQRKFNDTWVCPKKPDQDAARLDVRVLSTNGKNAYTVGAFDAENTQQIGWVSQYGDTSKSIIQTRTEGITGVTGACECVCVWLWWCWLW